METLEELRKHSEEANENGMPSNFNSLYGQCKNVDIRYDLPFKEYYTEYVLKQKPVVSVLASPQRQPCLQFVTTGRRLSEATWTATQHPIYSSLLTSVVIRKSLPNRGRRYRHVRGVGMIGRQRVAYRARKRGEDSLEVSV